MCQVYRKLQNMANPVGHSAFRYTETVMADLRSLPKVDALSSHPLLAELPARVRVDAAREAIGELREMLRAGASMNGHDPAARAYEIGRRMCRPSLRPMLNLSGVVLHTGLGRARLAPSAAERVREVAAAHSNLEIDLEDGRRGSRQEHVRHMLRKLTGAEDALVVNNAASGVLLTLASLASGHEVILSRGQMVEIGGSFRMPDIVRQAGCKLVEVGCTNKTHPSDYEGAIGEETAALLRCHPSNFSMVGFVEEVPLRDLREIANGRGIRLIDDQGSGCLVDLTRFGLPPQETLRDSAALADVSIASGDKLLGGPQAGLIVGRREAIARISKHPLARAVRIDKLAMAAVEETLRLYISGRELEIPVLKYLSRSVEEIGSLAARISGEIPGATTRSGESEVGGGSAPGTKLATVLVGIPAADPAALARALRLGDPGIVGRIEDGSIWLDPRTLEESEVQAVVSAVAEVTVV